MELKIDKGVPIPPKKPSKEGSLSFTLLKMDVGDSTFIPHTSQQIGGYFSRLAPKKFTTRLVTENGVKGVRVWRVE